MASATTGTVSAAEISSRARSGSWAGVSGRTGSGRAAV